MTDQDPSGEDDRPADVPTDATATAPVVSNYKVLGLFDSDGGAAVLGQNDADSGASVGVRGAVPNDPDGFGLATDDDAQVEGDIAATSGHTLTVGSDRTLRLTPHEVRQDFNSNDYTIGGNVVGGYRNNSADGAVGATIAGGGGEKATTNTGTVITAPAPNEVTDRWCAIGGGAANLAGDGDPSSVAAPYGTVAGGVDNRAGSGTGTTKGAYAAVGGGSSNIASNLGSTVGGGTGNVASGIDATVGGGGRNAADDRGATVAGGQNNTAGFTHATVGGGNGNTAQGKQSTVGGGVSNYASGFHATVGGGEANTADTAGGGTVGGGRRNTVSDNFGATVGGGFDNTAGSGADYSTVGGGLDNTADTGATYGTIGGGTSNYIKGEAATIGGGYNNEAGGVLFGGSNQDHTVAGGRNNRAIDEGATIGGGRNNQADGKLTTIPGGEDNRCQADYAFAAGRRAKARDAGAFVWADSTDADVDSTGNDQFIVRAAGGVGIRTNAPKTQLHVTDQFSATARDTPGNNVALLENTSSNDSPNVLGIQAGPSQPPGSTNFVTFYDSSGTSIGAVEGNNSGGVNYKSGDADLAEFFPKADPDATFDPGEVVGLEDGHVTDDPLDADAALVVSTAPMVTGNDPDDDEDEDDYVRLTLLGQVPVAVDPPVSAGDLLVAAGDHAVSRRRSDRANPPVVGLALRSVEDREEVRTLVGTPGLGGADGERIDDLERENDRLRRDNERLRERLATVESHLGIEADGTPPASADD